MGRKREEGAFSAVNVQHMAVIYGRAIPLEMCRQCSSPQQYIYHLGEDEEHEPGTGTGRRGEG
jgi:hypothetical protein